MVPSTAWRGGFKRLLSGWARPTTPERRDFLRAADHGMSGNSGEGVIRVEAERKPSGLGK